MILETYLELVPREQDKLEYVIFAQQFFVVEQVELF